MESLVRYYLLAMSQGRELFNRSNRGVYLVKRPALVADNDDDLDEDDGPTAIINLRDTDAAELQPRAQNEWAAAPIKKRPGYPPYNRVVVGRSRICDVVCGYGSVSKLHAHFHLEAFVPVAVSDEGSANGTFLNGRRLAPSVRAPLVLGDRLRLGDVDCELLDEDRLYDLLRSQM